MGYALQTEAKLGLIVSSLTIAAQDVLMLHTDLNNPTSNAIYQRIGYKKIGEWVVYSFHGDGPQ